MIKKEDIANISNKRINKIELVLGKGNAIVGKIIMRNFLKEFLDKGFLYHDIGKMIRKDRHVLHQWGKRYNLKPVKYTGFKKAILKLTLNKNKHNVKYGCYKKIDEGEYKVFYLYPTKNFAYVLGLILGDGYASHRQVYIRGGSYGFLDKIYPKIKEFGKYLGNKSTRIEYYDRNDKRVEREKSKSWKIFIQWSALAHFLNNKKLLKSSLKIMLNKKDLFNVFTAGFFDADGYLVYRKNKPERIGIDQSIKKWWFLIFYKKLEQNFTTAKNLRTRNYKIKQRGKLYTGINKSYTIRLMMSQWPKFVNEVIFPYCNKPIHLERALIFREHALKNKNRWRL